MDETKKQEALYESLKDTIFRGMDIVWKEQDPKERSKWQAYLTACMRLYAGFTGDMVDAQKAADEIELKYEQLKAERELKETELALKEREVAAKEKQNSIDEAKLLADQELREKEIALKDRELDIEEEKVVLLDRETAIKERQIAVEERKADNERLKIQLDYKSQRLSSIVKMVTVGVIVTALVISLWIAVAQFNAMMVFQQTGVWRSVKTVFDLGGGGGLISLATKMI